jgi:hypothetical protein
MKTSKSLKILKVLLTIFLMITHLSCINRKSDQKAEDVKPSPHFIDISEGFNNSSVIKLSDIADSIRYIILSKEKNTLIGDIGKIQISGDNIYLRGSDGMIMRFDMTGKFLNSFGNIGRGPIEYLPGSIFTTTPDDDEIIIFRSAMDSYLTFEPNGNFINTNKFPISRSLFDFRSLSDSVFLCTFYYVGSFMKDFAINWSFGLFDINGNPIKLIEHPLKNEKISESDNRNIISMAPTIAYFNNRIVLKPEGDTIYEIDENSIFKGYIIKWGQVPHKQNNRELFFRQVGSSNLVSVGPIVLETYDRVYLRVSRGSNTYLFEYNKITGLTRSMKEDPDNLGFVNDLDGGANFYPYYTNRAGDIWVIEEDAFTFKEMHSPEFLSNSMALNPKWKEKLVLFTDSLKQDDNSVLKIVYLKK